MPETDSPDTMMVHMHVHTSICWQHPIDHTCYVRRIVELEALLARTMVMLREIRSVTDKADAGIGKLIP